jgi:hypothetical protein
LKEVCHRTIRKAETGIGDVEGWHFPVQMICGKELSEDGNLWIRSMSKPFQGGDVETLFER